MSGTSIHEHWIPFRCKSQLSYQVYMYIYIHLYDSQIVHHNPCFNLFILHNNSFDNEGSEINKNDFFYVSTYCLLQKLSSYLCIILEWRASVLWKQKYLKHLLLSDISLLTKLSQALLKLEFFTFSQDYTEVEFTKLI